MINTLFGSGNSLGKCRLHGAPRINGARKGRCSSSSRGRIVIIPGETDSPRFKPRANCRADFFFLSFFFFPFSS